MKYQASVVAAAPIPAPTPTPTAAASSTTDKDTVPKTLPAGVYNQLAKDYGDVTLNGEKREFPEKVLLGADKVLAHVRHEHTVSKHYTAVTLGEIMSQRVFAALGTLDSARKKDDLDKRLVVDIKHQLVSKEPSDWEVRGLNMIQDGIDAVRWAWILIKFGTEKAVNKYCDWWTTLVRQNSTKLPQIKTLWESFAWDIAIRMRQTETFSTITTDELMADLSTVNDALVLSLKKKQRNTDNQDRYQDRYKGNKANGKGRGYKGKGKGYKGWNQQYNSPSWPAQWQMPPVPHGTSRLPSEPTSVPTTPDYATARHELATAPHQRLATTTAGATSPVSATQTKGQGPEKEQGSRMGERPALGTARPRARAYLSLFDGIGAASLAFLNLGIQPVLTMSWEIDAECIATLDEHFAPIHMGDVATFNIESFVKTLMDNVDHEKPIMVIATGGPPCPDFSAIKNQPAGTQGATGHLFQHTVNILSTIKEAPHPVPVHVLLENVVPHEDVKSDIVQLSNQFDIEPIIVDAADRAIIHHTGDFGGRL